MDAWKGNDMQDEKKPKKIRILAAVLGGLAAVLLVLYCAYRVWERPPEIEATPEPTAAPTAAAPSPTPTMEPMPEGLAFDTSRQDGVYTVLLVGGDRVSGNTDTMLVARFDTRKHEINVVSVPRDTIINVDWDIRKLNSVYAGSLNNGGTGIDSLTMHFRRLLGFDVDCYAVINLDYFVYLIDALGGVDFYVPFDMDYEDDSQGLYIHLKEGQQHLNGYEAMGLCRFRAAYVTGDLGRIEMQQAFMKACAEQFITLGNVPNAPIVLELMTDGLTTNLSRANIAWFIRQGLQCKSEDVHFYTMPCDQAVLQGYSYAVPRLGAWLEMINRELNPYDTQVTSANVDIVYRSGANYAATSGLQGAWYYEDPGPAPIVTPTPTQEPGGPTIIEVTPKPPETFPPEWMFLPSPTPSAETQEQAEPDSAAAPAPAAEETPGPAVTSPPAAEGETDETPDFAIRLGG